MKWIMLGCICLFFLSISLYILFRNEWVYRQRIKLRRTPEYEKLPSYQTMLYRKFWVWDINKFINNKP